MRLLALLASLLLTASVSAQCPGGRCSTPSLPPLMPMPQPQPDPDVFRWVETADPNQIALYRGRAQLGNWRIAEGGFFTLKGDTFTPGQCPVEPPPEAQTAKPLGLDVAAMKADGEGYWSNGKRISRTEAFRLIEQGIPDDAHLWRLTILSAEESLRQRVRADYDRAAELAPYRGKLVVQDYGPDAWAVNGLVKPQPGQVTIYLQRPDGYVLHRQDDYADGAAGLALALRTAEATPQSYTAIRKPGPYDPARDKDLRKPLKPAPDKPDPNQPTPSPLANVPGWAWIAGAIAALLALLKPKE